MPEINKLIKDIDDCAQALSRDELSAEAAEKKYTELEKLCSEAENESLGKSRTYLSPLLYYNNRENFFALTVIFKKSKIGVFPVDYVGDDKYISVASCLIRSRFSEIKDKRQMQFVSYEKKLNVFISYMEAEECEYVTAAVQSTKLAGLETFKIFSRTLGLYIKTGASKPPISIDYCLAVREEVKSFLIASLESGIKLKAAVFALASLTHIFNYSGLRILTMIADDMLRTLQRYFGHEAMTVIISSEIYLVLFPEENKEVVKEKLFLVYDNILLKHVRNDFSLGSTDDLDMVWTEIEKHLLEDDV